MSGEEKDVEMICQPTWSLYPTHHERNRQMHAWLDSEGLLPPEGLAALRKHLKWIQFKQRFLEAELKVAMQNWFPAPKHMEETRTFLFETDIPEREYQGIAANLLIAAKEWPTLYRNGKELVCYKGYLLHDINVDLPSFSQKKSQFHRPYQNLENLSSLYAAFRNLLEIGRSRNLTLPLLKAFYYLPWSLAAILGNGNLPWKFLCILREMYSPILKSNEFIRFHLSSNPSLDLKKLEDIPEDERDYPTLKQNSNIDWGISLSGLEITKRLEYTNYCRDLTPEIVEQYPDLPWEGFISRHPNFTWEWIQNHPEYDWKPDEVSENPNITLDIIQNNPDFFTTYKGICINPNLEVKDLRTSGIQEQWDSAINLFFFPQPWDEIQEMSDDKCGVGVGNDSLYFLWSRRIRWSERENIHGSSWREYRWRARLNEVEQLILKRLGKHQVREFYYKVVEKLNEPGKYHYEKDVEDFEQLLLKK